MRKLFSIFLVLFYTLIVYGQATVDIPITVSDNGGATADIYFGLDLTATDGLDVALGEAELPGIPPGGYFAAWLLPDFVTLSYNDYRAPGNPPAFPYTGHISHVIRIQTDIPTGNPMTVSWDLPSTILATSTIGVTGNMVSFSGIGSHSWNYNPVTLSYIFVEIDYLDIVPVELTSFTGIVVDAGIMLNWTTATELNNQGFDIERKSNTIGSWERIGYVPGNGTSTEPQTYSYLDENVPDGSYSYRLKQIDFSGAYEYSDEIVVNVGFSPTDYILFQNYPNPFNPNTSIQFQVYKTGVVNVKIYDMLGQEIKTLFNDEVEAGMYTIQWDGLNDNGMKMSSGSYIYRMTAGDFVDSKEMLLLK
jgi:hypothetical protein